MKDKNKGKCEWCGKRRNLIGEKGSEKNQICNECAKGEIK